jgi:hypothetical protein
MLPGQAKEILRVHCKHVQAAGCRWARARHCTVPHSIPASLQRDAALVYDRPIHQACSGSMSAHMRLLPGNGAMGNAGAAASASGCACQQPTCGMRMSMVRKLPRV